VRNLLARKIDQHLSPDFSFVFVTLDALFEKESCHPGWHARTKLADVMICALASVGELSTDSRKLSSDLIVLIRSLDVINTAFMCSMTSTVVRYMQPSKIASKPTTSPGFTMRIIAVFPRVEVKYSFACPEL